MSTSNTHPLAHPPLNRHPNEDFPSPGQSHTNSPPPVVPDDGPSTQATLYNFHPDFTPEAEQSYSPSGDPLIHHFSPRAGYSRHGSTSQLLLTGESFEPYPHRPQHFSSATLIDPAEQHLLSSAFPQPPSPSKSYHLPSKMAAQHHVSFHATGPEFPAKDGFCHFSSSESCVDENASSSPCSPAPFNHQPSESVPRNGGRSSSPPVKELVAFPVSPASRRHNLTTSRLIILGLIACLVIGAAIGVICYLHLRRLNAIHGISGDDGDVIANSGLGSARNGTGSEDDPFGGGPPKPETGPDNGQRGGANGYDSLIVFGASYCDNAHARPALYKDSLRPPPYYKGRWTDGYVWNEYLANMIGPAGGGTMLVNYAYGSATVDNTISSANVPDLQDQVDAFMSDLKAHSPGAGPYNGKSLVATWVGLNSITSIWNQVLKAEVKARTASEAHDSVTSAQSRINTSVDQIFTAIANVTKSSVFTGPPPDILLLPLPPGPLLLINIRAAKGNSRSLQTLANLSQMFNARFSSRLADLQAEVGPNQRVFTYDIPGLWQDFILNPVTYGLSVVDQPCLTHAGVCAHPNEYLFWDALHPTTYIHHKLATLLRDTIRS